MTSEREGWRQGRVASSAGATLPNKNFAPKVIGTEFANRYSLIAAFEREEQVLNGWSREVSFRHDGDARVHGLEDGLALQLHHGITDAFVAHAAGILDDE